MPKINKDWLIINKINKQNIETHINKIVQKLDPQPTDNITTHGKGSKQYSLYKHIKDSKFVDEIKDRIEKLLFDRFKEKVTINLVSSWTVYGQEHGYHVLHKHAYKKDKVMNIASVVYLSVPEPVEEPRLKETNNFYCILNNNNQITYYTYKPAVEDILIFPIWLWHGSYPQSKGLRHTLNLDFEVV
tara:strand:- start:78 stop:638 length:561 start_codon:yes stop_codon:yes gene_type:complete